MPRCFLIVPIKTKEAIDDFIDAMAKILEGANTKLLPNCHSPSRCAG